MLYPMIDEACDKLWHIQLGIEAIPNSRIVRELTRSRLSPIKCYHVERKTKITSVSN